MERIAKFEKVSYEQFKKDFINIFFYGEDSVSDEALQEYYNNISLPTRSTAGSAGYDFVTPTSITLNANQSITIPTGIRCKISDGWVLQCFPRSSLGFKFRMQLDNTVGIIDSDYYNADNEGHIMAKITNDNKEKKFLKINAGDRFIQGIFIPYGITEDDNSIEYRKGGIGSTGE